MAFITSNFAEDGDSMDSLPSSPSQISSCSFAVAETLHPSARSFSAHGSPEDTIYQPRFSTTESANQVEELNIPGPSSSQRKALIRREKSGNRSQRLGGLSILQISDINVFKWIHSFAIVLQDEMVAAKFRGIAESRAINDLFTQRRDSFQAHCANINRELPLEGKKQLPLLEWHSDTKLPKEFQSQFETLKNEVCQAQEMLRIATCNNQKLQEELGCKSSQIHSLAVELNDLKKKYSRQSQELKLCYNQVLELRGNIRVFCRSRPLSVMEQNCGTQSVLDFDAAQDDELIVNAAGGAKKRFKYDRVFPPSSTQVDVFADTEPVVISVLDGFNVCIFAYGQTGTGKTFTMEGTETDRGVTYRTLEKLFLVAMEREGHNEYDISVSVLEIYNEQIRDLLAQPTLAGQTAKKLEIKQTGEGLHQVPGLSEEKVHCIEEVWNVLQTGTRARTVGSTNANERSSRSHCMICVMVKGRNLLTGECTRSKLWLIDLAGSERIAKTEVQGERLKEAQSINKSLSALGDVIQALTSRSSHVPYRNSKLTHLLQDSLGGQSKALMFLQISPSEHDLGETLCSLNFASRARGVELGVAQKHLDPTELRKFKKLAEKSKQDGKVKDECLKELQDAMKVKEQLCKALSAKVKQNDELLATEKKARSIAEVKLKEQLSVNENQKTMIERLKQENKPKDPSHALELVGGVRRASCYGVPSFKRPPLRENIMDNRKRGAETIERPKKKAALGGWLQKENTFEDADFDNLQSRQHSKRNGRASIGILPSGCPSIPVIAPPSSVSRSKEIIGRQSLCIMPQRKQSNSAIPFPSLEASKTKNAIDVSFHTEYASEPTEEKENALYLPSRIAKKHTGRASLCIMPQRRPSTSAISFPPAEVRRKSVNEESLHKQNASQEPIESLPTRVLEKRRPGRASFCVMPRPSMTAGTICASPMNKSFSQNSINPYEDENHTSGAYVHSKAFLGTPAGATRVKSFQQLGLRSPHFQAYSSAFPGGGEGPTPLLQRGARRVSNIGPMKPPQHPQPQFAISRKRLLGEESVAISEDNYRFDKVGRLSIASAATTPWGQPQQQQHWRMPMPMAAAPPPATPSTPMASGCGTPMILGGAQRVLWNEQRSNAQPRPKGRGWNR